MENGAGAKMTVFGATLLEMMARRGLREWKQLSLLLEDRGHHFSPSTLSHWAFGRHTVHRTFGRAVAETLDLDDAEVTQLARAVMLGQGVPAGTPLRGERAS